MARRIFWKKSAKLSKGARLNKVNYDAEMEKIISDFKETDKKPALLLHACCAPCSSACLERVKDNFDISVYYYNPNIDSEEEYFKRAKEQERLCAELGVKVIIEKYLSDEFYSAVRGLENEPEGGKRCTECFRLRLEETARLAKERGFDFFCTTLNDKAVLGEVVLHRAVEQPERQGSGQDAEVLDGFLQPTMVFFRQRRIADREGDRAGFGLA